MLGADYELMKESGTGVLARFYIAAVVIIGILAISILSIRYAMMMLFHIWEVEVLLSFFLSALYILIYIFLINTFSKRGSKSADHFFTVSNISRFGFVAFMGFLISKPVEVWFADNEIEQAVATYKTTLCQNYSRRVNDLYVADIDKLKKRQAYYHRQENSFHTGNLAAETGILNREISAIEQKKTETINAACEEISRATFFIYRVKTVSQHISCWLLCFVLTVLFLLPGYLIYSISGDDRYFTIKKAKEESFILSQYQAFQEEYSKLFQQRYGMNIRHYSNYADPPFNTRKKGDNNYRPQADFFKRYHHENRS